MDNGITIPSGLEEFTEGQRDRAERKNLQRRQGKRGQRRQHGPL